MCVSTGAGQPRGMEQRLHVSERGKGRGEGREGEGRGGEWDGEGRGREGRGCVSVQEQDSHGGWSSVYT